MTTARCLSYNINTGLNLCYCTDCRKYKGVATNVVTVFTTSVTSLSSFLSISRMSAETESSHPNEVPCTLKGSKKLNLSSKKIKVNHLSKNQFIHRNIGGLLIVVKHKVTIDLSTFKVHLRRIKTTVSLTFLEP